MRLEESIGVAVAITVGVVALVFFLVATFVSAAPGFGTSGVTPVSGPPSGGTTTVVKLPGGKTATVTVPGVTTTGP